LRGCKSRHIIKIDYAVDIEQDNGEENRKRAIEKFDFESQLINKFSGVSVDFILENYTRTRIHVHNLEPLVYNDKYWLKYMDIGLEMLKDRHGIIIEHHYDNMYLAIPNNESEIITFIQSIQPEWFTTVLKI
jgi:hypothetical protein